MTCHQAIVWIDNREACILRMDRGLQQESTISAHDPLETHEGAAAVVSATRIEELSGYFDRVARALDVADEILVVGPSNTKTDFVNYMHKNEHAIDPRILGVETIAHRTDLQLAAFAKLYFTVGGPRRSGNGDGQKKST